MMFGRNEFRRRWLQSIEELTDYELQLVSWMDRSNQNPHWSFVEFLCCYFDEVLADTDYKEYENKGWVSKDEYAAIESWHKRLDKYIAPANSNNDHQAILSDPEWISLVSEGKLSKKKLAALLNPEERSVLVSLGNNEEYEKP